MQTEATEKARKARRTGSRRSLQKGDVLLVSETRNMVGGTQEDELAQAKAIVDKPERADVEAESQALSAAVEGPGGNAHCTEETQGGAL